MHSHTCAKLIQSNISPLLTSILCNDMVNNMFASYGKESLRPGFTRSSFGECPVKSQPRTWVSPPGQPTHDNQVSAFVKLCCETFKFSAQNTCTHNMTVGGKCNQCGRLRPHKTLCKSPFINLNSLCVFLYSLHSSALSSLFSLLLFTASLVVWLKERSSIKCLCCLWLLIPIPRSRYFCCD